MKQLVLNLLATKNILELLATLTGKHHVTFIHLFSALKEPCPDLHTLLTADANDPRMDSQANISSKFHL